jgi:hypothetical protein
VVSFEAEGPWILHLSLGHFTGCTSIVQSLGLPDLVSSVEVNIGEDSSEEPSASITFRLKSNPATDDIEMLNRFSKRVQSEVLLQDDLPWPYIRLEVPKA